MKPGDYVENRASGERGILLRGKLEVWVAGYRGTWALVDTAPLPEGELGSFLASLGPRYTPGEPA